MKRPTITDQMIADAANKLALENGWDVDQAKDIADEFRPHMDGYELAKRLDDHCGWDISVMDVENLDGMNSGVREIHRATCVEWVKTNDIKPPFPVGTSITKGVISGIYQHDAACYEVREYGETGPTRKLIIRYEDARLVA